jgi:PilZ domain
MAGVGAAPQRKDMRKNARRHLHHAARILVGQKGLQRGCRISDISEGGARLILDKDGDLPDRFVLLLTANGGARRRCRVVWRRELDVGVAFIEPGT